MKRTLTAMQRVMKRSVNGSNTRIERNSLTFSHTTPQSQMQNM